MSDTENRGRVLFILMTNRPDKLDIDIKRAGRLDRKIPFLYPQTPEEVGTGRPAQVVRKNRITTDVDFTLDRDAFSRSSSGYSNADVEAVLLLANDDAAREAGGDAPSRRRISSARRPTTSRAATRELLEYMELLAVFEASSRRLLPPKYAHADTRRARRAIAPTAGDGREQTIAVCGLQSSELRQ